MKRIYQTALFATLLALSLTGCNGSKKSKGGGGGGDVYAKYYKNQKDFNGNVVDDYHLKDTSGEELQKQIHHYLIDQHTNYLKYASILKYYPKTDQLEGTRGYEAFYTAGLYTGNSTTREHMWCCANSNGMWYRNSTEKEWHMDDKKESGEKEQYWGGGSDLFQLRPTTYDVNSARSNYKYYVYKDGETYETITDEGAPYSLKYNRTAKTCEVDDYFKGDVARTLMYIYMHYNSFDNYDVYYSNDDEPKPTYDINNAPQKSSQHTPYVCAPDRSDGSKWLQFNLIMNYGETECIRLLKQWNHDDPPSALEKQRNNYICNKEVQGNRNPFIDFPELVDACFPDIN